MLKTEQLAVGFTRSLVKTVNNWR